MVAGLGGFVLLIACANLANLQFARHAARHQEQAIRVALGASRGRLIAGVLAESLLLALAGGLLGLLVALWCNDALARHFVIDGASGFSMPLDFRALAFAGLAAIASGLGFGLLPAWFASRPDMNDALKSGGRGATANRAQHRLRHALVVAEVALALVLLAAAGLFLRGIDRARQRDLGWRADGIVTGQIGLRGQGYATEAQRRLFYEKLAPQLAALPGVERAAFGSSLPTWGFSNGSTFVVEGRPPATPGQEPETSYADISTGYFETLRLPLVAGRDFTADDRADTRPVAIISESLARAFWPNESPLGKRIGWDQAGLREIVGVARDARGAADAFGNSPNHFQLYRPIAQAPAGFISLALRTNAEPSAVAAAVRRAVAAIDPDQSVFDVGPLLLQIDGRLANLRLAGEVLAAFAVLGVTLAAIGIYGVMSGFVAQRTAEIGIRLALGAQIRDVLTLVVGRGLRLALIGAAVGLVGAGAVDRLLHALMAGLPPAEPATLLIVTLGLLAVAALACWLPARRAARLDPMAVLRAE